MNTGEELAKKFLEGRGFKIISKGWPDFLAIKEDEYGNKKVACFEIKAGKDKIRKEQAIVHAMLRLCGLKVHVLRVEELQKAKRMKTRVCFNEDGLEEMRNEGERLKLEAENLARRIEEHNEKLVECTALFGEDDPLLDEWVSSYSGFSLGYIASTQEKQFDRIVQQIDFNGSNEETIEVNDESLQ